MGSTSFAFYIGMVSGVLLAAAFVWWWRQRGGYRGQLKRSISKISRDSLSDIVIPDGIDGEIQIEQLLLTDHGLLVLDIKEIRGRLFGGDNMDDWTVIDQSQRFTFANPVGPMRERVIAIRTLLKDVPVQGRVVIIGDAQFSEGLPECVVSVTALQDEFAPEDKHTKTAVNAFYPYWDRLRQIAVPA